MSMDVYVRLLYENCHKITTELHLKFKELYSVSWTL